MSDYFLIGSLIQTKDIIKKFHKLIFIKFREIQNYQL